jgi:hypothetical protein
LADGAVGTDELLVLELAAGDFICKLFGVSFYFFENGAFQADPPQHAQVLAHGRLGYPESFSHFCLA